MSEPRNQREPSLGLRPRIGLFLGPILFALVLISPPPAGLETSGWRIAAMGVLMAVWWITEAIPIPATALLPIPLVPLLAAGTIDQATRPYANPLIFLFLGGFMIALAIERWGLHRRVALRIIGLIGTQPLNLIAGFMVSAALASMWISNTATTLMLLPIGLSVVAWFDAAHEDENFATFLLLAIAFGASVGGLGTLVGTPPNALMAALVAETLGLEIGFARWMLVGVPLVLIALPLTFLLLARAFPLTIKEIPGGDERVEGAVRESGPMTRGEKMVAIVFVLTAVTWITRPVLTRWIPGLTDPGIALTGGLALFLLPVDFARGEFLLRWRDTRRLPWGILVLFGGGLSLAASISRTGLAEWLGGILGGLGTWPFGLLLLVIAAVVILFSELASNTATAAAFLPIVAAVALAIGIDPLTLVIPTAIAASGGYMLPVATPPNAIVYSSGRITIPQMVRGGALLDLVFLILVPVAAYTLVPLVFGVGP